jgi:DNA modification methylase
MAPGECPVYNVCLTELKYSEILGVAQDVTGSKNGKYVQLELGLSPYSDDTNAGFNDPAFAGNKRLPIHRWVPWIAGFSSDFVQRAIKENLQDQGTVLDPFAGVGTALVEAILHGHNAIGFEINPYPFLASDVKVNADKIPIVALQTEISRFVEYYNSRLASRDTPISRPPEGFRTRAPFYSPEVLNKVLILQDFIYLITEPYVQLAFKLAFASTMVRYSNYSYEPSLGRRTSSGKEPIRDYPIGQTILEKLREMAEDIVWYQGALQHVIPASSRVINASFFDYKSYLSPASVDLIVTSPPYLNNYHYNRNTRPQLYWLGYAKQPGDLRYLEEASFGKFWQTVREREQIELQFSLPNTDLAARLDALRSVNPEKGIYGGKGWANYAATYFNDCYNFALALQDVLKPGGVALVVIGNSILQGILIPTDQYFAKIAEAVGLELVRIEVPRATRVGSSIIQSGVRAERAEDSHRLYEAVVELRKR